MFGVKRIGSVSALAIVLVASVASAEDLRARLPLLKSRVDPTVFGTTSDEITTISATSFVPGSSGYEYDTSATLARDYGLNTHVHSYATLNIPAGVVIDYIGVNNLTDTDGVMGVALWRRLSSSAVDLLAGFSFPAHAGWATDYAGPLNISITSHAQKVLILDIEQDASPTLEYFAWVEVWWHRTVSPPPATATFSDVPTSSPQFKFVEALHAAGITAGCGGGNYCPDAPITRGQMAVFLAVALGLHWPN